MSGLTTFRRFAQGLQQAEVALRAAFSLPFSNGVVECSVNKLILLKRQMFGHAGFVLSR
jgi:transposase